MSSQMTNFYSGKVILLTGATGFVGKYLVYKILKSFDIRVLYVLLRAKKGQSVQERMSTFYESSTFSGLSQDLLRKKLIGLEGDISLPKLGLKDSDYETLLTTVQVVINSGASIKYNDSLRVSAMANVSSIVSVIELCQAMSELQVFTHISTFAVFMPQRVVKEKIYTMAFDVNHFLADLKLLSDQEFESKYGKHIDDYINTYHMTKTIAERLLYERCSNLPLVIIRPSVVMPSYKEPFPGWFQGIQLSTGLMGLWTSGLIRTCIKHKDFLVPVIPVDTLGNFILVSTWTKFKSNKVDITIYNCTTDVHNSPTMGELAQIYGEIAEKCPSSKVLRSPLKVVPMASNIIVYQIKKFTHHTLFAHMADLFLRIKGEKPVVKDITRRMNIYLDVVEKELKRNKYFETDNFRQLWTVLDTEVYSAEFNMDLDSIDWTQHSLDHYMEFRRKILKESDSNLAHAKTMMKRLMLTSKCMDWSLNLLILTTFGYLVQRSKMIPTNAFTGLLQVIFRRN